MKKTTKVLAGLGVVAGFGVAIAPLATYADITSITDTLTITVNSTCTFSSAGEGSGQTTASTTNYYTETVANGAEATFVGNNFNNRTLRVVCNNNGGWHVTATPHNLTATGITENIAYVSSYGTADGTSGKWHATVTATGANPADPTAHNTATTIASGSSATAGQDVSVAYQVYVGTATPAATYTGTIEYALVTGSGS